MKSTDLHWLAGILEGEGCFYLGFYADRRGGKRPSLAIICAMTDKDVVERICSVAGCGKVYRKNRTPKKKNGELCKTAYEWRVHKLPLVKKLIKKLRPLMGERRKAKIDTMLAAAKNWRWRYVTTHGKRMMYTRGCRCCLCTRANTKVCYEARHRKLAKKQQQMAQCSSGESTAVMTTGLGRQGSFSVVTQSPEVQGWLF